MRFDKPRSARRARSRDSEVPMINVVLLLLIFFVMTASIGAPPPLEVDLARSGSASGSETSATALVVAADGTLALGAARGEAALAAAAAVTGPLDIRADAGLPASRLAHLLSRLADLGVTQTRLVTRPD